MCLHNRQVPSSPLVWNITFLLCKKKKKSQPVCLVSSCRDSFRVTSTPERMWNLLSAKASPLVLRGLNRSWNPTSADASVGQVMQQQEIFILALKRLIILFNILLQGGTVKPEKDLAKVLVSQFLFCGQHCSDLTWELQRFAFRLH